MKNRVVRLGRHRERGTPSGAANTFRAELADGRRAGGYGVSRGVGLGRRRTAGGGRRARQEAAVSGSERRRRPFG